MQPMPDHEYELGLIDEGMPVTATYRTTKGTDKTIEAEIDEIDRYRSGYRLFLTVEQNGDEKRRRISVATERINSGFSIHAYDRKTSSNWRRIGSGNIEDLEIDLDLGGWVQRGGSTRRWYHPEAKRKLYLTTPLDRDGFEIVVDDEVVLDGLDSEMEAVDTAEDLMNFKY